MKKKIISTSLVFLFILVFSTQVNGFEEFYFHDDITPGATFEWDIKTLSYSGDVTSDDFNMTVGEHVLTEGDVIKVEVTKDPDTIDWRAESWLNIYVNGELALTNSSEIYTEEGDDMFMPMWPIYPVTYTNDTGSYDLFEVMYQEVKEYEVHNSTSDTETYGDYIYYTESSETFEFSLEDNVFQVFMYMYFNITQENTVTNEVYYAIGELTYINRIDTVKGLLNQYYIKLKAETNMPQMNLAQEEGPMNGTVEVNMVRQGYTPPEDQNTEGTGTFIIPFEGLYALVGLSVVALVVLKRKRN